MMIPDDWRNNIPCILSRFLNFLVEAKFQCHCRHYPNMFCWRQKPRTEKRIKFLHKTDREKESFLKGFPSFFKEKLYYYATHFQDMGFVTLRFWEKKVVATRKSWWQAAELKSKECNLILNIENSNGLVY